MLRFSEPPGYRRTAPVRRPKLEGFTEIIDQWLKEDLKQLRKPRHTAKRIFDRLRAEHGFSGGYTIVKDVLLYNAQWPALYPPLRETLPAIFDGVELPPGEPDEDLYDERGRRLE